MVLSLFTFVYIQFVKNYWIMIIFCSPLLYLTDGYVVFSNRKLIINKWFGHIMFCMSKAPQHCPLSVVGTNSHCKQTVVDWVWSLTFEAEAIELAGDVGDKALGASAHVKFGNEVTDNAVEGLVISFHSLRSQHVLPQEAPHWLPLLALTGNTQQVEMKQNSSWSSWGTAMPCLHFNIQAASLFFVFCLLFSS